MNVSLSSWLVILLAVLAANLPFLSERILGIIPWRAPVKPFWVRLAEMFCLYAAVGLVAMLLESRIGNYFAQRWEFFAVTGCLFIVLAYPGFVYRYLRRRRS